MAKSKEKIMEIVFLLAACVSILAVALICVFLFANGIPAMKKIGFADFLLGTTWKPGNDIYGIFPMILGSIYVTAGAIIIGVPIGLLTAVFLAWYCPEKIYKVVKPAVELNRPGAIIIMATPVTLKEKKFKNLIAKYGDKAEVVSMPCPELVEYVESGDLKGKDVREYLENKFANYKREDISSVVLGCTHYPFVKDIIKDIVGKDIPVIDGGLGTSKELKRKLEELDMLTDSTDKGNIELYNSSNDKKMIEISKKLLNI